MDSSIFFGGSVIAAFVAGMIALFAPCCISVMLPAYFASSFQNRSVLVAMTFVFAGGIATIILPLVIGVSVVRHLLLSQHTLIFLMGGAFMLTLGLFTLLGGQIHLPMPGRQTGGKAGIFSVYSLGIFSGIASSCCAPVLAGVIALAGVASSFGLALGLGTAYVFGMVAPLFIISLLWEQYDWRSSRLFHPKPFTWKLGKFKRTIPFSNLTGGSLLTLMGIVTLWYGMTYQSMTPASGWQASMTLWLQRTGQTITQSLAWIPNWLMATVLLSILLGLAWVAINQITGSVRDSHWGGDAKHPDCHNHSKH